MTYSGHMVEHVVLAQIIPLLVVGRISVLASVRLPAPVSWVIGVATAIIASLPPMYSIARHDAAVLWAIRAALVISGLVFWRPIRVADPPALSAAMRILYLVVACFATTLAGAAITFGARTTDRQIGGLVMWVPCCLIYLSAVLAIVGRSLHGTATAQRRRGVVANSLE